MRLADFFVVFVVAVGETCLAGNLIKIDEPDGACELEEAAIQVLHNCYANQYKTLVVIGNFPGNFIKKLSSHEAISVVVLHHQDRLTDTVRIYNDVHKKSRRKEHVVVTSAETWQSGKVQNEMFLLSIYDNSMASFIVLNWSPNKGYGSCNNEFVISNLLGMYYVNNQVNVNVLCRDRSERIVLYTMNPFRDYAPEPWLSLGSVLAHGRPRFMFMREYRGHEGMCVNLNFDKTRNLNGFPINVFTYFSQDPRFKDNVCPVDPSRLSPVKRIRIEQIKHTTIVDRFIKYVNASKFNVWWRSYGTRIDTRCNYGFFYAKPFFVGDARKYSSTSYPHHVQCTVLITQFRGYKSQIEKVLGVIDIYSWIGIVVGYLTTLIFLKYFMRQYIVEGIMNLCRLTFNAGLTRLPADVASQIYLGCLLFVVVTFQGIFAGNLASMLTHDFPRRQVNSIKDLADLNYTVYILRKRDWNRFDDPVFKDRVVLTVDGENCIENVLSDPSVACLTWGAENIEYALNNESLYVSDSCISMEYGYNVIPWRWVLEEQFNNYLGIMEAAGTMMPSLKALVDEKIFNEKEAIETPPQPETMTLNDLGFAFVILGIGLGCATICFIMEIIVYRYQRSVTTSRITVLKRPGRENIL